MTWVESRAAGAGRELVLIGEFGRLDQLSHVAHSVFQDGNAAAAIRTCRVLEVLCEAAGDDQTLRYALYTRGLASIETGRGDEARDCATRLLALCQDDLRPFWHAKALALQANAQSARGDSSGALDLLARASVMLGTATGRDYNEVSANGAIAMALRRIELFEASDAQLRAMIPLLRPWDAITMVADSLHTVAEWGLALQVVGLAADAAAQFAVCASRAVWLHRLVADTGRPTFALFALTGEIFATTMLGDGEPALRRLPELLRRPELRQQRVERLLAHFALSVALIDAGDLDGARGHLMSLREVAVAEGRGTWIAISDAALLRLDVREFGVHPAVSRSSAMYQRLAQSQWFERQAQFDSLQSRMRVHRLIEEGAQITELSRRDALTGVGNRRVLEDLLAQACGPVSAVFVDVDNFKQVNDTFSHVVGDQVLVRLAALLRGAGRAVDTVVRYGGDEFLVLLDPSTSTLAGVAREAVIGLAARILQAVRRCDWADLAPGLTVTVSAGVVHHMAPAEVLTSASTALHAAKDAGRDRFAVARAEFASK